MHRLKEGILVVAQSKSRMVLVACLAFLAGVAGGSVLALSYDAVGQLTSVTVALGVFTILLLRRAIHRGLSSVATEDSPLRIVLLAVFSCFFASLGFLRVASVAPIIDESHIAFYADARLDFEGIVAEEPDQFIAEQRIIVEADRVKVGHCGVSSPTFPPPSRKGEETEGGGCWRTVGGRVMATLGGGTQIAYGDRALADCFLTKPKSVDDIPYDKYMARRDIFARCAKGAAVQVVGHNQGNSFIASLIRLKARATETLTRLLPEPHASLFAGILYGARTGIPRDLLDAFNRTGLTHMVAMSGFNISIITDWIFVALVVTVLPRRPALALTILLVVAFVLFVGAHASIIRAAIMGLVAPVIYELRRPYAAWRALLYSATIMVASSPLILLYDPGFALSFLATLGLILFSAKIARFCKWIPEVFGMREAVIATIAALIATMPYLVYVFGRLSPIALIANPLVVPLTPLLMVWGALLFAVAGFSMQAAAVLAAVPGVALSYIIMIARVLGGLPFAALTVPKASSVAFVAAYALLAAWGMGWIKALRSVFVQEKPVVQFEGQEWKIEDEQ